MTKNGCRIGGEQSGHIIFSKYASTGDGILTSLKMIEVMLAKKMSLSKLAEPLKIYPQVLENVCVTDKKAAQEAVFKVGHIDIFNPWSVINYIADNCFQKVF